MKIANNINTQQRACRWSRILGLVSPDLQTRFTVFAKRCGAPLLVQRFLYLFVQTKYHCIPNRQL